MPHSNSLAVHMIYVLRNPLKAFKQQDSLFIFMTLILGAAISVGGVIIASIYDKQVPIRTTDDDEGLSTSQTICQLSGVGIGSIGLGIVMICFCILLNRLRERIYSIPPENTQFFTNATASYGTVAIDTTALEQMESSSNSNVSARLGA